MPRGGENHAQGGEKIAQGGEKISRAQARDSIFLPPPLGNFSCTPLYVYVVYVYIYIDT